MFDTVLLRSLLAVADSGGFTRAAERLHLTQSAISAHIRRLESEAGQKLLERTTRSVSLTPAGARLAGYARTILALHDDARASLGVGRRVFLMAPIHHHFELSGWSETQVVGVFYLVNGLLVAIAYLFR